ncbi:Lrp/AsnC family transcriptional regulator [Desulfoscipio gibsoniae]|uniref:Transcriptional regulator n=1 Tax=Desulfoscipio gibsoniae DSM 7213 TaxID=767817 RepID=R4KRU2_9FIRM|nr:Lrp/AsnC family transcriptional regulator [Desulfoscipio gibsoniae]AGL02321.1 transcriptional regulator [Desulfoscipio gibsoniae DSM 7213]
MLDNTDKRILAELSRNSRITMKELGEKVHLTGQAVSSRVSKLEDNGIIEGYTIKVNQAKLGYSVHVMINIYTKSDYHQPYLSFISSQEQYIMHNYKISGDGCYLLECKFPSNELLDKFLIDLNKYVNYKLTIIINETTKIRENKSFLAEL